MLRTEALKRRASLMKTMCKGKVNEFVNFLEKRIERQYQKIADSMADHRVLIKTERAEAEMILGMFLKILNDKN
jgi:hypothetical protein